MAIDWTTVEGYREDMTADEKLALLDNMNIGQNDPAPDPKPAPESKPAAPKGSAYVTKAMFDKVSSELSSAKKELQKRMSTEELAEAERTAKWTEMQTELETLRRERAISNYNSGFLTLSYEKDLAEQAANALADGDFDTLFGVMQKHSAAVEKNLRAQILKETPVPPAGAEPNNDAKKKEEENALRESFGLPPLP